MVNFNMSKDLLGFSCYEVICAIRLGYTCEVMKVDFLRYCGVMSLARRGCTCCEVTTVDFLGCMPVVNL